MKQKIFFTLAGMICLVLLGFHDAFAQTTTFTYQGRLTNNSAAANGNFDMQFRLFDTQVVGTGTQHGNTITNPSVQVANGVFTVNLDFGANVFNGAVRSLEISVRPAGSTGNYTPLNPRQQITSSPYAVQSVNATNAAQLGGIAASQYVQTNDARLSDARDPLGGSANYVQNTTSQQAANFNVSGNGTIGGTVSAKTVDAQTQYNIGGIRVFSIASDNVFAGAYAGTYNTTGLNNAFFGLFAGEGNTTGSNNSYFGTTAGQFATEGNSNTFIGNGAGYSNSSGSSNTFLGSGSGTYNTTGNNNTFIGASTNPFIANNLNYATAIGAGSLALTSNSITLGRFTGEDTVRIPGSVNLNGVLKLNALGTAGGSALCRNASNEISNCSSSLRYKTNVAPFFSGLSLVKQLNPISYNWKDGNAADVGFGAEDVARINPLFVTYNKQGEVEGVKYDRLSVAFVNAFKEQQQQIDEQRRQIEEQKNMINALKVLVCQQNPQAELCRDK